MINVLSLFDGMSCGRIALERAGIPVGAYAASELDKYAIKVSTANWPEIRQLGDVKGVRVADLGFIPDLVIGGSPCQGFSFAGKQLAFDDPRSALFFEYVRLVNEARALNPNVKFLLENVRMKQEHVDVITKYLGVQPVVINSALVSAQNRVRYYWANWEITQPQDLGIYLRDVLESTPKNPTIMSERFTRRNADTGCLITADKPKAANLSAMEYVKNGRQGYYIAIDSITGGCIVGRRLNPETGRRDDYNPKIEAVQRVETHEDGNGTTFVPVTNIDRIVGRRINPATDTRDDYNKNLPIVQCLQVKHNSDKAGCLTTVNKDNVLASLPPGRYKNAYKDLKEGIHYRKLTPIECERLQTVPDNYTAHVSSSQRYKMLGNGWTVDVIAHIFKSLAKEWGLDLA